MSGIERFARERERQKEVEGWTPEHDRTHVNGELVYAAVAYAHELIGMDGIFMWPWDDKFWKPADGISVQDQIKNLTKAGALLAAEVDRLEELL